MSEEKIHPKQISHLGDAAVSVYYQKQQYKDKINQP
jgi:hypothetical protein